MSDNKQSDLLSGLDHKEQDDNSVGVGMGCHEVADSDVDRSCLSKASTPQKRRIKPSHLQRRHRFSSPVASETESESDNERASEYGSDDGSSASDSTSDSCFSRASRTLSTSSSLSVNTSANHRVSVRLKHGSTLPLVGFLRRKGSSLTLMLAVHTTSSQQAPSIAQLQIDEKDLSDKN